MYIEVCFYKQYDLDLVGLRENGYPIGNMLKKALIGYANGAPIKFYVDECDIVKLADSKSFRVRMNITDEKTIELLKNIRNRMRNTFCKMLLRDSLVTQSLSVFYTNSSFCELEKNKLANVHLDAVPNIYVLNKHKIRQGKLKLKNDILLKAVSGDNKPINFTTPPNELEELKAMVNTLVMQNQALMSQQSKTTEQMAKKEEKLQLNTYKNDTSEIKSDKIKEDTHIASTEIVSESKDEPEASFNPNNMNVDDDLMSLFDGIME